MSAVPPVNGIVPPETEAFAFEPVDRTRLSRYLEVPSVDELDPTTLAEIDRLDAERNELLAFWKSAVALPIDRLEGAWIELEGGVRLPSTAEFVRQLARFEADWLVLAAFSLGDRVDRRIAGHTAGDDPFSAFVLKQWSATMAEQTRAKLTLDLCAWADRRDRSLLPFSGPGYRGWPLTEMSRLLGLLGATPESPIRAIESGMLVPVNSMVIAMGATPRRAKLQRATDLAQCHRCAMRNCRYRVTPLRPDVEPEIVGVAG